MQLSPGVFLLFCHHRKPHNFSLYYVLGAESFFTLLWLFTLLILLPSFSPIIFWILGSILIIESTVCLFFYYRKGPGTALFISRPLAKSLDLRAKNTKKRSDAFLLGFSSNIPELVFTLPLYLIANLVLPSLSSVLPYAAYIMIFILIAILPLFIIYALYRTDHNLAEIERLRVKSKPFVRLFLFFGFLALAILTISLGVISYG